MADSDNKTQPTSPTRPPAAHAGETTLTVVPTLAKIQEKPPFPEPEGVKNEGGSSEGYFDSGRANNGEATTEKAVVTASSLTTLHDVIVLLAIFIMLIWPWIFFGVVWQLDGIEMNARAAKVVTDHPQATSFFVTLIGNIICLLVNILFSIAIIRFSQEWVTSRVIGERHVTVFHVSLLSAFRHQSWPWKLTDLKHLIFRHRWVPVALVGACIATFAFVPSSTTSLIGPVLFNRTIALTGTELDFASASSECSAWFDAHPIPNNCDWREHKGLRYTNCLGENQLVDVLESGRGNILSLLSNNTQSLVLSQLGGKDGLHFLGPIRGILPMGPNGVPAFDTVTPSITKSRPYNYTLDHQGLGSTVSCIYDSQTPVRGTPVDSLNLVLQYNATCPAGTNNFLSDSGVISYRAPNSNNSLVFWACETPSETSNTTPSYTLYLRGRANYASAIGNITCTVSPIEAEVYSVAYESHPGVFRISNGTAASSTIFPQLIQSAVKSVGTLISEAQNFQSNLVAESVITFGVKSFGLEPYVRTDQYLRLYESMLQGVIEYGLTYTRLIYSSVEDPPASCVRTLSGSYIYETVGWEATSENIGFLFPITIVNLAAFIIMLLGLSMSKPGTRDYDFDPTDPNSLILAKHDLAASVETHEWSDNVTYRPRQAIQLLRRSASEALSPNLDTVKSVVGV